MNDWLLGGGLDWAKALLKTLALPPLPMLLLAVLGLLLLGRRPRLGRALAWAGLLATWAVATPWAGEVLVRHLTQPPPTLDAARIAGLRGAPHTAVLVLGGGTRRQLLDYGAPDLNMLTLERLRYGQWLARQTGLPLGYTGGIARGLEPGATEAAVARAAQARDHGVPLRWAEDRARDTQENARFSVDLLQADGITRVVLVTHGAHQRRALAAFARAAAATGRPLDLVPAPVGLRAPPTGKVTDFLPSPQGLEASWMAVYEWLGRLAGA